MKPVFTSLLLALTSTWLAARADENWNQFRGPRGDGVSVVENIPIEFDEARNVRWKIAIPDQGWSSPVVWDNEIWLTTGSDKNRELRAICVDLESGKVLKDIKVFDMLERKVDPAYVHDSPHLNSPATPTSVVEQDRVYVSFGSQGIACLDRMTGRKLWERRDLRIYQPVRQGSSPIVDDENLYVAFDGTDQQFFVALDKETGETRWRKDRNVQTDWDDTLKKRGLSPKKSGGKPNDNKKSFATATLVNVDGQRQLIAPAAEATIAYDPATGNEIWRVMQPGGFNVAARPIHANGMVYVFTSGLTGYLMGIRPDAIGNVTDTHVAWSTTKGTPHIPSPVVVDDMLFLVSGGGIARCLEAKTGDELWKLRLGGDHWASPLYVNGNLYFSSKQGDVTVVPASREQPEITSRNKLNASFIASPAVAGSSLILRSTNHLYCIADGYQRSEAEVAKERMQAQREAAKELPASASKKGAAARWEAAYEKLLATDEEVRRKVEAGGATKEQVIAWMKQTRSAASMKGKSAEKIAKGGKAETTPDRVGFYAVVVGRLRTKDIELGEFTFDVDHVSSANRNRWVRDEIVGKTVNVTGVSGQFLDNLLQIRRGDTLKVRVGSYLRKSQTLAFGPKFHVLERTAPFRPEDFGVPPAEFRGFRGELTGTIVEAAGYEMLLEVQTLQPAENSEATDAECIKGRRVQIVGFYNEHRELYADLHEGDTIRVSVAHPNPASDALNVTDVLTRVEK